MTVHPPQLPLKSWRALFQTRRRRCASWLVPLLALVSVSAQTIERGPNGVIAAGEPSPLLYLPSYEECLQSAKPVLTRKDLYRDGWIDLNKNGRKDVYEDPTQPVEKRVDDLLSQMTLEEKTCQTATLYGYQRVLRDYLPTESWRTALWKDGVANIDEELTGFPYFNKNEKDVPGVAYLWPASKHTWALNEIQRFFIEDTRLGVPAEFTTEGIRGVEHYKATDFPMQLALGQTWNRALIRRIGVVTAREAHALGYNNVYGPILDVLRDPRWGRCEETYGEDPFLVSELAIPMVQGMQGEHIVSTLKHYVGYSGIKGAREGSARTDPQVTPRELEMIHVWPFERVIREANPLGIMCSYNDYDGVPVAGSRYWLSEVLRDRLGFKGYVVSDSGAVEFLAGLKHAVAANYKEAVYQTIMAGLNVRTNFNTPKAFVDPLRELVREGRVPMAVLDARVRDVLRVKFWEGLFDRPFRPLANVDETVLNPKHEELSRQASRECLVLLKNENNLLPLDAARIRTIALCGPNADNEHANKGRYGPDNPEIVTLRRALEQRFAGKATVLYTPGCGFFDAKWPDTEIMREPPTAEEQSAIDLAVANARRADVAIVVVGDTPRGRPDIRSTVGEDSSRTSLDLTGRQDDLIRAVAAVGKPTIVINLSGRPVALNWANRLCPAIIQAFFPGRFGGEALTDALFGDYNPGGKLTCTFPKTAGQVPLNIPAKPGANAEGLKSDRIYVSGLLWPFGHGLSYTTFKYSDLEIQPTGQSADGNIVVKCKLTNTGPRAGDEIVQLYVRQNFASVITWEKRLAGFERIHLAPGESQTVTLTIASECLTLWNREMKRVVEPGKFKVMVGASYEDIRLAGGFEITPQIPAASDKSGDFR